VGLRFILLPFSWLFGFIAQCRWILFDKGVLKRKQSTLPTIVVGNIKVGGTGKSPMILLLIEELIKEGYTLAVLSRGYGRETKGFLEVFTSLSAVQCGDEPLMIKKRFPDVVVTVCENRVAGVSQIATLFPKTQVILLDDAFQHFRLKASLYILLTEWQHPFYRDFPMPTGMLREFRSAAYRADIIITTKAPVNVNEKVKSEHCQHIRRYSNAMQFFSAIEYLLPMNITTTQTISWDEVVGRGAVLVTGIANPNLIVNYLNDKKVPFKHFKFSDHAHLSEQQVSEITQFARSTNQIVLTTEKDAARIPTEWLDGGIWFILPMSNSIESKDELIQKLKSVISPAKSSGNS